MFWFRFSGWFLFQRFVERRFLDSLLKAPPRSTRGPTAVAFGPAGVSYPMVVDAGRDQGEKRPAPIGDCQITHRVAPSRGVSERGLNSMAYTLSLTLSLEGEGNLN